ncbi:MAG TPA: hypothetical protein VEY95_01885 [Azospirillaceae bacterium]|nr:hypothetical protein [Azospirillaceae bacterium]
MTGSSVNRLAAALIAAITLPAAAAAQSGQPLRLGPPPPQRAAPAPMGQAPVDPAPVDQVPTDPANPPPAPAQASPTLLGVPPGTAGTSGSDAPPPGADIRSSGIQIVPLEDPGEAWTGLLDRLNGGFGRRMWADTPRPTVDRLLAALPTGMASPAMRDLAVRLLLSQAAAPPGDEDIDAIDAKRVAKLVALGERRTVAELTARMPDALDNAEIARLAAESRLLAGDAEAACSDVREPASRFGGPDWIRITAVCHLVALDTAAALAELGALRDLGVRDDAFFALADHLMGRGGTGAPPLANPSPLHLAMANMAQLPLPADVLTARDPMRLSAVADNAHTDPAIRLVAVERLAAAGATNAETLAAAYEGVRFSLPELSAGPQATLRMDRPRARAFLYQAALRETSPTARADLLRRFIEAMEPGMATGPAGELAARRLAEGLAPDRTYAALAPQLTTVLYATGERARPVPWHELALRAADADPGQALTAARLWPLAAVSGVVPPDGANGARRWRDAETRADGQGASGRTADVAALLSAAGVVLPDAAGLPTSGGEAAAADLGRLEAAARAGRLGETVLLSLAALGDAGPRGAPAAVSAAVVRALRAVGLEDEARAIAREAMLARLG